MRARGSRRRAGGGAAVGARARAALALSARAELRSARLFCAPRLGMLGFEALTALRLSHGLLSPLQQTHLYPDPPFIFHPSSMVL